MALQIWDKFGSLRSKGVSAGLVTLLIRVSGAGVGFLSHLLLARLVDPVEYGVYVFAWTIVVLLGTVSAIGMPVAATKFVATYQDQEKLETLNRFMRFAVLVGAGVAVLFAGSLLFTVTALPTTVLETIYRPALFVGAFCVPLFTLTEIGKGLARGLGRNAVAYAPAYLWRPILIGAGVIILFLGGFDLMSSNVMLFSLLALFLALLWQFWFLRRHFVQPKLSQMPKGLRKEWLTTALPLTTMEAYNLLLANTDILVLKFFVTPDQLAVYFIAAKIAALLGFVTFAVSASAGKPIAAAFARGDGAQVQALMRRFTAMAFWPTFLGFMGLVGLGPVLLLLFGEVYAVAYIPLLILSSGLLVQSFAAVTKFGLAMTGGQRGLSVTLVASLILNVVLNFVLVPQFGVYGAAVATLLTTIVSVGAMLVLTKKRLGFWAVAGLPVLPKIS